MLTGRLATPTTITLYGTVGEFKLNNSKFVVRYFSTYANPSGPSGHADLVDELKPMRERLDAASLNDLASLMQRDLNDKRVAQELIPYLLGTKNNEIGFFPSILAVVVPKGYLQSSGISYPKPEQTIEEDMPTISYGDRWKVSQYVQEGVKLPLGLLRIVRSQTEIIVIDGQHRANAFRFVSNKFDDAQNRIYKPFYENLEPVVGYNVDLPVTLIWFESAEEIKPVLIARRLFVDVNNTAKPVNRARTNLLDDRTISCIATQEVYKSSARNRFAPDSFSLLHNAFDADSDIDTATLTKFTLTTPDIINDALRWALFSPHVFDKLTLWASSELKKNQKPDKLSRIFPDATDYTVSNDSYDGYSYIFTDAASADKFRASFHQHYLPVINGMLSSLNFLQPHYLACKDVDEWIKTKGTEVREVWKDVFCGGEGLYGSFASLSIHKPDDLADKYKRAIKEIETEFQKFRASRYNALAIDRVDSVYDSFRTKAFQTGYVCAVEYLVWKGFSANWTSSANDLNLALNSYTLDQWTTIFNELRSNLLVVTTPKKWPSYRNLLLRMYDAPRDKIYNINNFIETSPDYHIFKQKNEETVSDLKNYDSKPDDLEVSNRVKTNIDETIATLLSAGLKAKWFDRDTLLNDAVSLSLAQIEAHFKTG